MKPIPLISVIVPAYNAEKTIVETLESVAKQTYRNVECVVVDDCSTDDTVEVVRKEALKYRFSPRIRVVCKEKNGGISTSRNVGIDNAKGEFVFFLDADDIIVPECLSIHYRALEESGSDFTNANMRVDGGLMAMSHYNERKVLEGHKSLQTEYFESPCNSACNKLVSKKLFDNGALRFIEGMMYEDCVWTLELFSMARKGVVLTEKTYVYVVRAGSISQNYAPDHSRRRLRDYRRMLEARRSKIEDCVADMDVKKLAGGVMMRDMTRIRYQVCRMNLPVSERRAAYRGFGDFANPHGALVDKILAKLPYDLFNILVAKPLNAYKAFKNRNRANG